MNRIDYLRVAWDRTNVEIRPAMPLVIARATAAQQVAARECLPAFATALRLGWYF
jgi:hypothetical protein